MTITYTNRINVDVGYWALPFPLCGRRNPFLT